MFSTGFQKGSGSPLDGKQPCGPNRGSPTQWVQSSAGVPTDSCCGHNVQGAEVRSKRASVYILFITTTDDKLLLFFNLLII